MDSKRTRNPDQVDPRNTAKHTEELVEMATSETSRCGDEPKLASCIVLYMIALIQSYHPNNQIRLRT